MVKPWRKRRQATLAAILFLGVAVVAAQRPSTAPRPAMQPAATRSGSAPVAPAVNLAAAQDVVAKTCVGCHSDRVRAGNLSLQSFDINTAADHADVTERDDPQAARRLDAAGRCAAPGRSSTDLPTRSKRKRMRRLMRHRRAGERSSG
jgi:hypothetical protein